MSAQVLTFKLPALEAEPLALPLAQQLPRGRLTEIARLTSGAQLSLAVSCVAFAQAQGEPVAWLQRQGGSLYPPDLADGGVDLDALLVVHVPIHASASAARAAGCSAAGCSALCKAAELLLRSGGLGLVVIDLVEAGEKGGLDLAMQSRLLGLAREHDSAVLLLSEGPLQGSSLGPLVGLCIEPHRQRTARGAFRIEPRARKDKSGSLCALAVESRRGPWGLL